MSKMKEDVIDRICSSVVKRYKDDQRFFWELTPNFRSVEATSVLVAALEDGVAVRCRTVKSKKDIEIIVVETVRSDEFGNFISKTERGFIRTASALKHVRHAFDLQQTLRRARYRRK